jgi:hypothetical protein
MERRQPPGRVSRVLGILRLQPAAASLT